MLLFVTDDALWGRLPLSGIEAWKFAAAALHRKSCRNGRSGEERRQGRGRREFLSCCWTLKNCTVNVRFLLPFYAIPWYLYRQTTRHRRRKEWMPLATGWACLTLDSFTWKHKAACCTKYLAWLMCTLVFFLYTAKDVALIDPDELEVYGSETLATKQLTSYTFEVILSRVLRRFLLGIRTSLSKISSSCLSTVLLGANLEWKIKFLQNLGASYATCNSWP